MPGLFFIAMRYEGKDLETGLNPMATDRINPQHYKSHPSGVECITVTEHMGFCLGNAVKYIWRFPETGNLDDLRKARWYIDREISRQEKGRARGDSPSRNSKPDGKPEGVVDGPPDPLRSTHWEPAINQRTSDRGRTTYGFPSPLVREEFHRPEPND